MNHKYINKETFEIVDNVFEVDEDKLLVKNKLLFSDWGVGIKYDLYNWG